MQRSDPFRWVHFGALALVGVGLAWGNVLMSLGQLLLVGNTIVSGIVRRDLGVRARRAFREPVLLIFLSFYVLHVIGLLWTSDLGWGLDLCRILAPLVVLPITLSMADPLSEAERRSLLLLFAAGTVASTFACLALRPGGPALTDFRSLSVFVSHIRLALLLCMSAAILVWYWPAKTSLRALCALTVGWSVFFLTQLESLQGLVILALALMLLLSIKVARWPSRWRWAMVIFVLITVGSLTFNTMRWVREHYRAEEVDLTHLPVYSAGGEMYYHDRQHPQWENGHAVWINVADKELKRCWERRSTLGFDGNDGKGHPLRFTLVRYLASKGSTKDSVGMRSLTDDDVHRIEMGLPSALYGRRGAVRERVEEILFELDEYALTGDPSGYSIAMRLEFWKTGLSIAKREWLHGVGTGDTQQAFDAEYERRASRLQAHWRLRAHNEYLTLWITFGAIGFAWCLFSWILPVWGSRAYRDPLFLVWAIAFAISCCTDDTPETQAGATFFGFFYALFVFGTRHAGSRLTSPGRP
jgi:hypothetical protein